MKWLKGLFSMLAVALVCGPAAFAADPTWTVMTPDGFSAGDLVTTVSGVLFAALAAVVGLALGIALVRAVVRWIKRAYSGGV